MYKILVGKAERKRPLGRRGLRREGNIKMGVREIKYEDVDRIYETKDMVQ
jgi:hypothetical protein